MFLTNPIWLFALAAISIPIIIHLWNIKPGKTLKVGSISLFSQSSPASSRSFKLLDVLLLLIRCLLLVLLAFLLTAPLWRQHLNMTKTKGWVLVPSAYFKETYNKFKPTIDSLVKNGYEFHDFDANFGKHDTAAVQKESVIKDTANYWELINLLSAKISSATPVELFTSNKATHFTGSKPQTSLNIHWHTYTPADTINNWLAGAWLTNTGSIKVLQGISHPPGTYYQNIEIKNGSQKTGNYILNIDDGLPYVTLQNEKIIVDTTTQQIAIYANKNMVDANYVRSALQAIAQLTQRKTNIKLYNRAELIPAGQDWIYWLTDKPVAISLANKAKHLFTYESGKTAEVNSWLTNSPPYSLAQEQPKIALYKTVEAQNSTDQSIWTDGFGNPMLNLEHKGNLVVYHFYSRFNPAWNDLVWSDDFPKWLLSLTQPWLKESPVHDRKILSDTQIKPDVTIAKDTLQSQEITFTDITRYLWLVLVLVFFAERWLATKTKLTLANG